MRSVLAPFLGSLRDLAPIVLVIGFFQAVVVRQPLPEVSAILSGAVLVVLGLTLFIRGLEMGLFPLGESMARAFARKGSAFWLFTFAFALGFGTTVAEPALVAVADKAAETVATAGVIADTDVARAEYALVLRYVVALAVGSAVLLGVLRILKGWPLHYLVITGYALVLALTSIAPESIIGIAYDAGGVTTSTITVPLVTALGVGLASSIEGRNPVLDGFGIIAFASVMPILFVLAYGVVL
ncbi:DUF1538 family protein [Thiohalospira halophila]|uniref:DUF1538 family protein n=1 Tax=Thiohalospira halophila TaxID=381300 RepID=UPI000B813825